MLMIMLELLELPSSLIRVLGIGLGLGVGGQTKEFFFIIYLCVNSKELLLLQTQLTSPFSLTCVKYKNNESELVGCDGRSTNLHLSIVLQVKGLYEFHVFI